MVWASGQDAAGRPPSEGFRAHPTGRRHRARFRTRWRDYISHLACQSFGSPERSWKTCLALPLLLTRVGKEEKDGWLGLRKCFFRCRLFVCSALCLPLQVSPVQRTDVAPAPSPRSTAPPAATSHMPTAPSPPRHPTPLTGRRPTHSPVTSSSIVRRAKASASSSSARSTGPRRLPPTVSPLIVLVVFYRVEYMLSHPLYCITSAEPHVEALRHI